MQVEVSNPVYNDEYAMDKNGFIPVVCLVRLATQRGNCAKGHEVPDNRPHNRLWTSWIAILAKYDPNWWSKASVLLVTTEANWNAMAQGRSVEQEDYNVRIAVSGYDP
jgi:hypothetical protein